MNITITASQVVLCLEEDTRVVLPAFHLICKPLLYPVLYITLQFPPRGRNLGTLVLCPATQSAKTCG